MVARSRWRMAAAVAIGGLALGVAPGAAHAQPYESVRFQDSSTEVVKKFCGNLRVRIDAHDQGHFILRPTGPDRVPRYTSTHHGGATYTNLASGKAFTLTWSYGEMDTSVTDNGDGTYTAVTQIPGPERIYGPDGQLVSTSGGTMRISLVFDTNDTPDDPADDFLVSETFLGEHGGAPQPTVDFCAQFRSLTA